MEISRNPEVGKNTPSVVSYLGKMTMGQSSEAQGEITVPAVPVELPVAEVVQRPESPVTPEKPPLLTNTLELIMPPEGYGVSKEHQCFWRQFSEQGYIIGTWLMPEEVPMTLREKETFSEASQSIVDIAKKAGVDTRMSLKSIHIIPEQDAYNAVRKQIGSTSNDSVASVSIFAGMTVDREAYQRYENDNPDELFRVATHEFMHLGQKVRVDYTANGEGGKGLIFTGIRHPTEHPPGSTLGMENLGGRALVEAMAEMGCFNAMRRAEKTGYLNLRGAYGFPTIVLDGVILETARFHGKAPEEIENSLYRANFGGDPEALAMISEALGLERTEVLWTLPHRLQSGAEIANVIETLDIEEVRRNAKWVYDGVMPPLFAWQQNAPDS